MKRAVGWKDHLIQQCQVVGPYEAVNRLGGSWLDGWVKPVQAVVPIFHLTKNKEEQHGKL